MKYLESLRLHNIVLFKDAVLPLNHKGVTKIQGYNKDADKRNSADNTNAAGKSLLASCIAQIIVGSDAVTQDIKSRAKKDFFSEKDSSMTVEFRSDKKGVVQSIEKKAKGKGFDYVLKKDGKELNTRTLAYAEQKIREAFPYTEDEFYTLYYVDSRKPNALQFGTPVQRLDFFTNLFKLNDYDEVRKLFNGLLSSLKKDSIVLREVEESLSKLTEEIGDSDIKELEARYEDVKAKQKKVNGEIHRLYETVQAASIVTSNKKTMQKFNDLTVELDFANQYADEESLRKHCKRVTATIRELTALETQAKKYAEYLAKKEQYDEQYQALRSKLSKVKGSFTKQHAKQHEADIERAKELRDKIKRLEKEIEVSDFDLDFFENYAGQYKAKYNKRATKENISELLEQYRTDKAKVISKFEEADELVKSLEGIQDCPECPTCRQSIDKKVSKKLIEYAKGKAKAEREYADRLQAKIEKVKKFLVLFDKHEAYVEAQNAQKKLAKLRTELEVVEKAVKGGEEHYENYRKSAKYREQMDSLVLPVQFKKPVGDYSLLPKLREWLQLYAVINHIYDKYHAAPKDIEKKAAEAEQRMADLKKKAAKYVEEIARVSSQLEVLKNNRKRLKDLKTRKSELAEKTQDIPVVELLIDAYSNKGVKLLIIKQIAAIIEKNMNKFAPLLYKERIKFTFDVDVNRFDILMERNYKGKKRVSDVRRLSGAESRAFSFLLPLAILPLIPSERRLNIMVMDEPTVNLDYSMRNLFTNSFIPKLNSVIPHIIIVSPLDDQYKNQKVYTVIKEGGFSTLVAS